jgi:fructokinase
LTEGADGATVFRADTETHLPAAPVAVIDSIGAGDAFAAGFLARWVGSDPNAPAAAAEAAAFAIRVAGVACTVRGATPPADVATRLTNADGRPEGRSDDA